MGLAYHTIIAIVELVVYVPGVCLALLLGTRHGFRSSGTWHFLIIFCLIRTAGCICVIIAEQAGSNNAFVAAIVCNSVGLAPLILLCMGMLSRVNSHTTRPIPPRTFPCLSLISFVGFILVITGGSRQNDRTTYTVQPESQAGLCLFLVVYLGTVTILALLYTRRATVAPGEKRLLLAVSLCVPFLAVRISYALIVEFGNFNSFDPVDGNITIYLCMSVVMEIIIVIIILGFGITLRIQPKKEVSHVTKSRKHVHKARGPISWVYYSIKDAKERNVTEKVNNGLNFTSEITEVTAKSHQTLGATGVAD